MLASSLLFVMGIQSNVVQREQLTFLFAYQTGTIESTTFESMRKCETLEELEPVLVKLGLTAKSDHKGLVFIFPSNDKIDNYIAQKKKVMDFFLAEGVGRRSETWNKVTTGSQLPKFCFDYLNSSVMTSYNTRLTPQSPILPQLSCKIVFSSSDKEVSIDVSMRSPISKASTEKMRGIAPMEGDIAKSEKNFPATLEEAVAQYPFVTFTLSGLTMKCWGVPLYNSKAAATYENYFKDLRMRSEESEEKLRSLYREFLSQLSKQDSLWSELNELKGKKGSSISKELSNLILPLMVDEKRFLNEKEALAFL